MGTTPQGLPYPEPTDPIADGATAIKNLAAAVNQPVSGRVTIVITSAVAASITVTFPAGYFTAPPRVMATASLTSFDGYAANTFPPTATGVTISAFNVTWASKTINVPVDWMAVK